MLSMLALALLAQGLAQGQGGGECPRQVEDARRAFEAKQFEAAEAAFGRAVAECPPRADLLLAHGQVLYLVGKEIEAEARMRAAVEVDPNHVPALYALGRLYYQQKRYPEAIAQLDRVVRLDAEHHRAWDNLGLCYDALNRDSDALKHFFKALDIVMKKHPDYDWAHANLADFFLRREQYEKAFQLAAEAARRNPGSARNAFLTGKSLSKLGKDELSLRWLEQAVKLDGDYSEAWYLLAQTYRKLGRGAEAGQALGRFKEAQAKGPARR
ncbi:MAG: tetratricopeptide repeat protein [Bryobacteraceae bacterium]